MQKNNSIYHSKKVLVTGHTGFKGSWLSAWLLSLGAEVIGLSNKIPTSPSNYEASHIDKLVKNYTQDIRDLDGVRKIVNEVKPDFIFHLAAQPLVRLSYMQPIETITTNAVGSSNLLESVRELDQNVVVIMITSDKAYDNMEWIWGYRETDKLGGKDPYSASKGMAELAIRSYVESFFRSSTNIRLGVARAGNVIGGGDWAQDRIVPDCMKSCFNGSFVDVRYPKATRPWQHVLEPLSGYLSLGSELFNSPNKHGEAYNFGPSDDQNFSVESLLIEMTKNWQELQWNDTSDKNDNMHEAGLLKLNCDKALSDLKWRSTLYFEETVQMTVEWYKRFYNSNQENMYDYTMSQIDEYAQLANERNIEVKK